jgi:hypothetical protein
MRNICASNIFQANQRTSILSCVRNNERLQSTNTTRLLFLKGAFWGLMVGLVAGMTRFVWQQSYEEPKCVNIGLTPDMRPDIITKMHYLHFSVILFFITSITSWVISLMTKPIPIEYVG